jgi:HAD superfamily hydrolase (TIGR01509 family)
MSGRFDLVIFDCDGVLIDSELLSVEADIACLAEDGIALTATEILDRYVGVSMAGMIADIEARYGRVLPTDFAVRHRRRLAALFAERLRPVKGIEAVVDSVDGDKCVASSSALDRLDLSLSLVGLRERFAPHIFSATQVARGKPAPDLFLFAAARMGAIPARCVVIEDSPAGVAAAIAAGMVAFGLTGGCHCRPGHAARLTAAGASCVAARAQDLLPLLKG